MPRNSWQRRRTHYRSGHECRQLSLALILAWADAHYQRTGSWPGVYSGQVYTGPLGETWRKLDNALRYGLRGLPSGTSLAQLLTRDRGVRNCQQLRPLEEEHILRWAQAHHRRTGTWPKPNTGPVPEQPGEWWRNVDAALREGRRGLPGNSSLAKLFAQRLGLRTRANPPRLTEAGILAWADGHWERTGSWPNRRSGPLAEAPGETWHALDVALQQGHRGLRGKSSLAQLLGEHRGVRTRARLPCLTLPQILSWALGNYYRQGNWPTARSGAVVEECGETWSGVDTALRKGLRGLPGGSSLAQLLEPSGYMAAVTAPQRQHDTPDAG